MINVQALTDLPKRGDLFSQADWQAHFASNTGNRQRIVRDPLLFLEGPRPQVVWGFNAGERRLHFLYGMPVGEFSARPDLYDDRRHQVALYGSWTRALVSLTGSGMRFEQFMTMIYSSSSGASYKPDALNRDDISTFAQEYEFYIRDYLQLRLVALYPKSMLRTSDVGITTGRTPELTGAINSMLSTIYDYHFSFQNIWSSLPVHVYSMDDWPTGWSPYVVDPLAFHVASDDREDVALWPWQRCLYLTRHPDEGALEVCYRSLRTTSVVVDIRASTAALSTSLSAEEFVKFVDLVVNEVRFTAVRNGGYFDKETGDGAVVHFLEPVKAECGDSSAVTSTHTDEKFDWNFFRGDRVVSNTEGALKFVTDIGRSIMTLCADYQTHLWHGMDGLGPGIGIHQQDAVWLVDQNQVRAIGSSVVGATRLCSVAEPNEVVMSRSFFNSAQEAVLKGVFVESRKVNLHARELGSTGGYYGIGVSIEELGRHIDLD